MIPVPASLIAFAARIGIKGAIIAALAMFAVVQTVRLEGLNIWPIHIEGCKARSARLSADLAKVVAAQAEAQKRAVAAREAQERRFEQLAKDTDNELEQARLAVRGSDTDYVARNRLRPQAVSGATGGTLAAPGDSPAGSGDSADPAPIVDAFAGFSDPVAVEAADIVICSDNTLRLEAVQEWALGLNVGE